jgi:DNA-binding response OmpR family regulator
MRCWMLTPDGARLPVPDGGLLVGRSSRCDLVLSDAHASRRHALIRAGTEVEVVPFRRNVVLVAGVPTTEAHELQHGDVLGLPGLDLVVEIDGPPIPAWWLIRGGYTMRLPPGGSTVGGAATDDLRVPGFPRAALRLKPVQGSLVAAVAPGIQRNGEAVTVATMVEVHPGDEFSCGGEAFELGPVMAIGETTIAATALPASERYADRVELEVLPNGGRLTVDFGGEQRSVRLSEMRCQLMILLMHPPDGLATGAAIADESLLRALWPRDLDKSSQNINLLVHRLRRTLADADLNPFLLIDRQVGSVRLRASSSTQVALR